MFRFPKKEKGNPYRKDTVKGKGKGIHTERQPQERERQRARDSDRERGRERERERNAYRKVTLRQGKGTGKEIV